MLTLISKLPFLFYVFFEVLQLDIGCPFDLKFASISEEFT